MFPTRIKFVVAIVLVVFSSVSSASIVRNLYTATVEVENQTDSARRSVAPQALAKVLAKVTGRADTRSDPSFSSMMSRATRYVEQFRYVSEGNGGERRLKLRFKFDQRVIDRDLQERNIAIWGAERPKNLAIVVVKTENGRELVGSNSESALAEQVRALVAAAGAARGVQLLFPLLDLEDQRALPVNEVWTGITTDYSALRRRYAADSVLIARLELKARTAPVAPAGGTGLAETVYDGAGRWESWAGVISGQQWTYPEYQELSEAVNLGVGELASRYARLYAIGGQPEVQSDGITVADKGVAHVVVEGISNYLDYRKMLKHIEGRSVVKSVSVVQLDMSDLLLAVSLKGTVAQLEQAFTLGRILKPVQRDYPIQPLKDHDGNIVAPPLPPFPDAKYYAFGG